MLLYVELSGKRSHWLKQKKGLPQRSVLAPILFNIYVNDQPVHHNTWTFLFHVHDLCTTIETVDFSEAEAILWERHLTTNLSSYYDANHLRANPPKTQVCAFHLKNMHSNRKLNISWNGTVLEHCDNPVCLDFTFDRSLTFRTHVIKLKER